MPTFDFTSPDGKSYTVNAPPGTTQEDAFKRLQQSLSQQSAPADPAPSDPGSGIIGSFRRATESAQRGVAKSAAGLAVGAGQLLGDIPPVGRAFKTFRQAMPWLDEKASQLTQFAESPGKNWWETAGYLGGTMASGFRAPAALSNLATRALGQAGGRVATAAAEGGAQSALQPTQSGDIKSHLTQGAIGAGLGGALGAFGASAGAQAMEQAGIRTTPGANIPLVGREWERYIGRLPVINRIVGMGRTQSVNDFNRFLYRDALDPLRTTAGGPATVPTGVGSQGLQQLRDTIGSRLDSVLRGASMNDLQGLAGDLGTIRSNARASGMGRDMWTALDNEISKTLSWPLVGMGGAIPGNRLVGRNGVVSVLQQAADKALSSNDLKQQMLGRAIQRVEKAVLDRTTFAGPGNAGRQELDAAREAYARYMDINRASRGVRSDGLADPDSMLAEMKKENADLYARGGFRQQDFMKQARDYVPRAAERVPGISPWEIAMSGRSGSHGSDIGVMGALGTLGYFGHPILAGSALGPAAMYFPPVSNTLSALARANRARSGLATFGATAIEQ